MTTCRIELDPRLFTGAESTLLRSSDFAVSTFEYSTGVAGLRVVNARGSLTILPFMGQILWDAEFDGVRLGMDSPLQEPRPAGTIVETYGCLSYHAGILRNGNPSPRDDHALHGELPCARMDAAWLEVGSDGGTPMLRVVGRYEHIEAFGARYVAHPSITLRADSTCFGISLDVENLSYRPMDVMYLCHLNFGFWKGARLVQPAPFTPERTQVRTSVPSHVVRTREFDALLARLASDPSTLETLEDPERLDPEQVMFIRHPAPSTDGLVHFLMQRPEGDGAVVSFDPKIFSHVLRWLLFNPDQKVAAFALPATCEPDGYLAERSKGNVRTLAPGGRITFDVQAGYLDRVEAARVAEAIRLASPLDA